MFTQIVVPVDLSDRHQPALDLDVHNGQVCSSVSYQVDLFCVCPVLLLK